MNFFTSDSLTDEQISSGQKYFLKDSLAGEAMVNLSGGAFVTAMAIYLGASNFQIGLLASLPILTNIFQLLSIWLVKRYSNRRAVAVISSLLGRVPMLFAGFLPFMFSAAVSLKLLLVILFVHYFFGSIAGASWNAWVKDVIPEGKLGSFFSQRTKLVTILSAVLGLAISFTIDMVRSYHSPYLKVTYYAIFVIGGIIGLVGIYWLSHAPEPTPLAVEGNVFEQFKKPLKDKNFVNLLRFNAAWAFALNLAVPFFTVFLMRTIGLPLSYVMGLTIIAQLGNILTIKKLGKLTDQYSNKTIIKICAPLYAACIFLWTYAAMTDNKLYSLGILAAISLLSGVATGGINLALNNIGLKLAPRREAMAYISSLNMVVAFFSAMAPIIGGLLADFFSTQHLVWNIQWTGVDGHRTFTMINLHGWSFLFIIGGVMALASLRLLSSVQEKGEVQRQHVVHYMRMRLRKRIIKDSVSAVNHGVIQPVRKVRKAIQLQFL